jgi:PAS domain S-box-containing protein
LAAITARDEGGAPVCRITLSDITERKQAEEALRNRDARHSKMISNIGDVIVIIDREGINRYKSPNVEKLFGWRAEELVGVDALDKVHPDDLDSTRKVLGGLLGEPNVIRTTELRYRRKDGRYRWIEFTGVNLSHDPDIRGLLGNYRDITERKQAEELHLQMQKTESLGRMAGAIAHHFNNKLQTVMLRLKIETTSQLQNPALVESLGKVMQSTLEAAEVSTLLLTYLGQSQVSYKPLDLAEECRASLPRLRVAMPTNVDLETDLPSPGPVISANANQIQQVLTSLMTNAWEAKSEGPNRIRLGVKSVTAADISQRRRFPLDYQAQEAAYACLEVVDAGGGITAKDMETLFEPFFSTKFKGRGLGLPVVLGIVRSHHGVITVESEPGRGSIFRCFFPVTAEAARPKLLPVPVGPGSENVRRGNTVLVVEDEESLRETLALTLELNDHTVLTAKDGVAAVEIFRQHQDEIGGVLCDVNMPRMNGWETLMALRKLAPDLPVILLSGYSDDQVLAVDHPDLPQAFLHKPCEVQVLLNAINQMMAKKKE